MKGPPPLRGRSVSEASQEEALGALGNERPRPAPLPEAGEGAVPLTPTQSRRARRSSGPRGKLFRKYVALFVAVVCVALITNGAFEIGFSYQECAFRRS